MEMDAPFCSGASILFLPKARTVFDKQPESCIMSLFAERPAIAGESGFEGLIIECKGQGMEQERARSNPLYSVLIALIVLTIPFYCLGFVLLAWTNNGRAMPTPGTTPTPTVGVATPVGPTLTPTASPTPGTVTPTATPWVPPTFTPTLTPTPTFTPTPTPTPTETPLPSPTPTETPVPTELPTDTPTPSP